MNFFRGVFLILIFLGTSISLRASEALTGGDLERARSLYYKAVNDENSLDAAVELFEKIGEKNEDLEGLAKVYVGSLTAMKARYTFWPQKKMDLAYQGIDIMNQGIEKDSDNIEALFIQGTTLYYLPFFFEKRREAEAKLIKIIDLANADLASIYGEELLANAIKFTAEKVDLDRIRKEKADRLISELSD